MEKSYWNESGKYQDFFDNILEEAPSFGFTNNAYMNALIAMSNVYFDLRKNYSDNIKELYQSDFERYASRFLPNYPLETLVYSDTNLAEQAMDHLLEQLQNKSLDYEKYTVWWSYKERVLSLAEPKDKSDMDWSFVTFGEINTMHAWCNEQVSFNDISDITEEVIFMNQTEKMSNPQLPEHCYTLHPDSGSLIILVNGMPGFYECNWSTKDRDRNADMANHLNRKLGITQAQLTAMEFGSMYGWDKPGADPKAYIKPALSERISAATNRSSEQIHFPSKAKTRPLANQR